MTFKHFYDFHIVMLIIMRMTPLRLREKGRYKFLCTIITIIL